MAQHSFSFSSPSLSHVGRAEQERSADNPLSLPPRRTSASKNLPSLPSFLFPLPLLLSSKCRQKCSPKKYFTDFRSKRDSHIFSRVQSCIFFSFLLSNIRMLWTFVLYYTVQQRKRSCKWHQTVLLPFALTLSAKNEQWKWIVLPDMDNIWMLLLELRLCSLTFRRMGMPKGLEK